MQTLKQTTVHIKLFATTFILFICSYGYGQRLVDKADKYFDKNLFSEAIPIYEQATKEGDAKSKEYAMAKLADCYRIIGEFEKAEVLYKKILSKKKKDPLNLLNYAQSLKSAAKYAEASNQFKEYIRLKPDDPMGPVYLKSCDSAQIWLDETIGKEAKNITTVNTEASDFAPSLSPNGELIFGSSRLGGTQAFISFNGGMEVQRMDLYMIDLKALTSEDASQITNLKSFNTPSHEASATFTKDGKEMYFTKTVAGKKDKKNNKVLNTLQVFYSVKDSMGNWTKPINAFAFGSNEYSIGHPSVSADGQTIYYMSDMPGGYGTTDIYYSSKNKDGSWSNPINLGSDVNTFGHELFPFIAESGKIYFSSDGHPGMGQLDIFYATKIKGKWTKVRNMKPPVNSIANDFGVALDGVYMRGFFSSDRFNGLGAEDIYSFSEEVPLEITIKGNRIYFPDNSVYDELKYKLINEKDSLEKTLISMNGKYSVSLDNSEDYKLVAKKNGRPFNKIELKIKSDTASGLLQEATINSTMQNIYVRGVLTEKDTSGNTAPATNYNVALTQGASTKEKTTLSSDGEFSFKQALIADNTYSIKSIKSAGGGNGNIACKATIVFEGKPYMGASVLLLEDGLLVKKLISDDEGVAEFELTPDADYSLVAQKQGIDTVYAHFTANSSEAKRGINKVLTLKSVNNITFKGKINNLTPELRNARIVLRSENQIISETKCDKNGDFDFELLPDKDYNVTATGKGYLQKDISFTTKGKLSSSVIKNEIKMDEIAINSIMTFEDILFVSGKAVVEVSSLSNLNKLVEFMATNPSVFVELSAHTDSRGDADDNLKLSQARAEYVKTYLILEDIDQKRVKALGYGESKLKVKEEKTAKDFQTNRRLEIKIISQTK